MKKIDVLIATYNGEKYIEALLDSLLNQTCSDFRIIIIDDCSEDATLKRLNNYKGKFDEFEIYVNTQNVGYLKSFEALIKLSNADFFMLCDQDDVWLSHKVEASYNCIRKMKVDLVFTDLIVVDSSLNVIKKSFNRYMKIKPNRITKSDQVLIKNLATGCTMICRNGIKKQLLPFMQLKEECFIHDWLILVVADIFGKWYYLDEPTVLYRQHDRNQVGARKKRCLGVKYMKLERERYLNKRIEFSRLLNERYNNCYLNFYDLMVNIKKGELRKSGLMYFISLFKVNGFFELCKYIFILLIIENEDNK